MVKKECQAEAYQVFHDIRVALAAAVINQPEWKR